LIKVQKNNFSHVLFSHASKGLSESGSITEVLTAFLLGSKNCSFVSTWHLPLHKTNGLLSHLLHSTSFFNCLLWETGATMQKET
jgi:hypothetical protein